MAASVAEQFDVVGATRSLRGARCDEVLVVVGVMPPEFRFAEPVDAWPCRGAECFSAAAYSDERLAARYDAELANGVGNLSVGSAAGTWLPPIAGPRAPTAA